MIDFLTSKDHAHDHTSGDDMESMHDLGTVATVFGSGKLRQECSTRNLKASKKQTCYSVADRQEHRPSSLLPLECRTTECEGTPRRRFVEQHGMVTRSDLAHQFCLNIPVEQKTQ